MDGESYTAYRYRLRSSGSVPVNPGEFLVQTFGASKNLITTWPATTTITKSDDFAGASIGAPYISASFQRLAYLTQTGDNIFSGNTVGKDEFIQEESIPGS